MIPPCTPPPFWSLNGGIGGLGGPGLWQRAGLDATPSTENLFGPQASWVEDLTPLLQPSLWFCQDSVCPWSWGAFRLSASRVVILRPRVLELWVLPLMDSLIRCYLASGCSSSLHTWGSPRLCIQMSHQFSMRMNQGPC